MHLSIPKIATALLVSAFVFTTGFVLGNAFAQEPNATVSARPVLAPLSPVTFTVPVYVGAFQEAVDAMKFYDEVARISAATDGWSGDPATAGGGGPVPVVPRLPGGSIPSTGPSSCEGKVVPAAILYRESHCSYDSVNPSSGAFGLYQFMPSTWSASCSDLDTGPAGQDECAARISNGGQNLSPWAG